MLTNVTSFVTEKDDDHTRSRYRSELCAVLTNGVKPKDAMKVIEGLETSNHDKAAITKDYIYRSQKQHENMTPEDSLLNERCKPTKANLGKRGHSYCSDDELEIYTTFFDDNTTQSSGASNDLREMRFAKYEFQAMLYADYPRLLRLLILKKPELVSTVQNKDMKDLTRFELSLLSAHSESKRGHVDDAKEYATRKKKIMYEYYRQLRCNRKDTGADYASGFADNAVFMSIMKDLDDALSAAQGSCGGSKTVDDSENVSWYDPKPVTSVTFWIIMKQQKKRYTYCVKDKNCPIHDKGEAWNVQLQTITRGLASAMSRLEECEKQRSSAPEGSKDLLDLHTSLSAACDELLSKKRHAQTQCDKYERHLRQYETARPYVKSIQEGLKPGEMLMYRDFVNQYTHNGQLKNLVLVCMWRETVCNELNILKIHNFCTDKNTAHTTSHFVADVFKHHFDEGKKGGLFGRFKKIYISGDHGPHFSSMDTIFMESTYWEKYGVEIECVFLCSYHAYNRCDQAGVEAKKVADEWTRKQRGASDAGVLADLINFSSYSNSVAVPFDKINCGKNVFPKALKKGKLDKNTALRDQCEVCMFLVFS